MADGVNWGIKPRLAARCAMHGFFDHLNKCLYDSSNPPQTTQDIFHCILRSFHSGQKLIIQHGGTTTTLCAGVVVELQEQRGMPKWGLCIVSVGDTLCYLWRGDVQMAYEITSAMHMGKERNARDCGGCLGCDLGDQPDLSNLFCFFVPIADNDVVFIVSDGVSDNFDPVVLKEGVAEGRPISPISPISPGLGTSATTPQQKHALDGLVSQVCSGFPSTNQSSNSDSNQLPVLNPDQRQTLSLMKLTKTLRDKVKSVGYSLDAQDVKDAIINHVIEATEIKRDFLEHCWVELDKPDVTLKERRVNERKIAKHVKFLPGKLDHASMAVYKVGKISLGVDLRSKCPTHSYMMKREPEVPSKTLSYSRSVFYRGSVLAQEAHNESSDRSFGQRREKEVRGHSRRHRGMVKAHSTDCQLDKEHNSADLLSARAPFRRGSTIDAYDTSLNHEGDNGDEVKA